MEQKAGTIHRTPYTHETFMVSWKLAQTPMDPDTLGVIIYLLSKPVDWMTSTAEVEAHFNIGRERRQRIFAEAQRLGHITSRRVQGTGGKWMGMAWQVWDNAVPEDQRTADGKTDGRLNRQSAEPSVGKAVRLHEEEISHEEEIRNISKSHSSAPAAASKPTASLKNPSTDTRSQHAAILAVRGIMRRYPNKEVWDQLIAALGEQPDRELLRRCWDKWTAMGFRPINMAWALDWYPKGGPPPPPKSYVAQTDKDIYDEKVRKYNEQMRDWDEAQERFRNELDRKRKEASQ